MEEKVLTREEIALSVLNGIMSSLYPSGLGSEGIVGDGSHQARDRERICALAFQMADLFILERDKLG